MKAEPDGAGVLQRALQARGLLPTVVPDEPSAMVALAQWSQQGVARRVLIVVDPTRWGRLDELADAVCAYHGATYCWQFDVRAGAEPMLSVLEAGMGRDLVGEIEEGVVGKIHRRPVDALLVKPSACELSAREVVTQQELTMLLGPAPGEAG